MAARSSPLPAARAEARPLALRRGRAALKYAVALTIAVVFLTPMVWTLSTSLKDLGDVLLIPPQWVPDVPRWSNFVDVFQTTPFARYAVNTLIITFLSVIGKIFSCSLVAYSFARLRWRGRNLLFIIMLATLMLPSQVTLIPQFVMFRNLGWIDTYLPLVVPHWLGGPFLTFLLRQYFMTIPTDLDEAAVIDGASPLRVLWSIVAPQAIPAIVAVTLFHFFFAWNEFLMSLVYVGGNPDLWPLSLGMQKFAALYVTRPPLVQASAILAIIVPVVVFFLSQRAFMRGVVMTGVEK